MAFTVCYSSNTKRIVSNVEVEQLTPYAAVCYVLLQSGAVDEADSIQWPTDYDGILEVARASGITNIQCHRALGKKRRS